MDYPALEEDVQDFRAAVNSFNTALRNNSLVGTGHWLGLISDAHVRFWTHMGGEAAKMQYGLAWKIHCSMKDAELQAHISYKDMRRQLLFPPTVQAPRRSARIAAQYVQF